MAVFIAASRRAGRTSAESLGRTRARTDQALRSMILSSVNVLSDFEPTDDFARRVVRFESDPRDVALMQRELPDDMIVEPAIEHHRLNTLPPLDLMRGDHKAPGACGTGTKVAVFVHWDGAPLAEARVKAFFRGPPGQPSRSFEVRTDPAGYALIDFDVGVWHLAALVVVPYCGHWPMLVRGFTGGNVHVSCPPLPAPGPGWWQEYMGVKADPTRGQNIRVGVIDTGCGGHPDLAHVNDVGAFIGSTHDATSGAGADVDCHGTHVCGAIAARAPVPHALDGFQGLSAGVGLFSARVFPDPFSSALQDDIINAIDALSLQHAVDLINLSLGSSHASQLEHDAIVDALDRGTLCICAAGNSAPTAPDVLFPAAFPECVAVSALGLDSWAPPGSLAASRLPSQPELFGEQGLFLASFSCFGTPISVGAPGVGIIAPVPARHGHSHPYAAMDGTSMASPLACATLAATLSADPGYLALSRSRVRAEKARQLLVNGAKNIGLDSRYQGRGLARP